MTWGFPAAFWLAAVAIPIVALFLYRRRSKVVEVPAVQVWAQIGRPVSVSSMSSLLRRLPALLVQLLLVMLLVAAVADPSPPKAQTSRLVIVLDASATMQTREGGETRMEMARREARRVMERAGKEAEVVVLRAAPGPIVAAAVTKDAEAARRAIDQAESLDIEGDLERTVRAALSFIDPRGPTDVVVVSDFLAADPAVLRKTWHASAKLRLVQVGAAHANAAIVGLWSGSEGADRRVIATIVQRGLADREVPVHLSVDGRRVATQRVTLTDEPVRASLVAAIPAGATFEVNVEAGDALAVDDSAFGVAPLQEGLSVCLVTEGNAALERALSADPAVRLRVVKPSAFAGPAGDAVVVVDGPAWTARDPGDARGYLFLNAADPFGWRRVTGQTAVPPVTHWDGGHPALADTDPTLFRISQAETVEWSAGSLPVELVGADRWPVMAELKRDPGNGRSVRFLYWLFDLKDTDLPRRLSFPLLIWNAVDYLATGGVPTRPDWRPVGRPLEVIGPATGTVSPAPVIVDPAGRALTARSTANGWLISDTNRQGIYRSRDGREAFALNLLSARATSTLPVIREAVDRDDDAGKQAEASLLARLLRGMTWQSLLIAAIIVGLIEWVLYNRRWLRIG